MPLLAQASFLECRPATAPTPRVRAESARKRVQSIFALAIASEMASQTAMVWRQQPRLDAPAWQTVS
jgi:hypothetical protein